MDNNSQQDDPKEDELRLQKGLDLNTESTGHKMSNNQLSIPEFPFFFWFGNLNKVITICLHGANSSKQTNTVLKRYHSFNKIKYGIITRELLSFP